MNTGRWAGVALFTLIGAAGVSAQAAPAQKPAPPQNGSANAALSETDRRSLAYYHFTMARMYEQLYEQQYDSGRSNYATLAIENYRKAYELDPRADVIGERLAEMYAKSQRTRDAVLEAQEILKRDPGNLAARRLLARIYVRTLGDMSPSAGQRETATRAIEQYREILRIDPTDSDSALWLARLYRLQNEHEKAEEVLRALVAADAGNEEALEQLSQLLIDQGKTQEAVALLEKAAATSPTAGLLVLLGDAYAQLDENAKAEEAFRRAVGLDAGDANARRKLARALLAQGKNEAALEQFQRLVDAEPGDAESHLRMAQIYRRLGKLDLAEESVVRARQRAPGSLEVIYNEAMVYEAQGRFDDAVRTLSTAVNGLKSRAARPEAADQNRHSLSILYEQLGRLYREVENYPAALSTYQEMMNLGKAEAQQARALVIETYRADKQMDRALAESQKALDADPADRGARLMHAMLLSENGQTDQAVALLRPLLQGAREDREVYLTLAQAYERGRRYADAEQAVREAQKLARLPAENEVTWFLLGAIYERQKKFDLAEAEFKRVLQVNPRNAGALNYYGYMLADLGVRLEEATALVKRALAEDAQNGAYLDSLGWAYYKQNRLSEAEEHLRKAAERSRHDPTIRDHLGDVYYKLGRIEQAAAEWEKSLVEWKRAVPAEYEPDRANEVEKKLRQLKNRLAQQKPSGETKP